MKKILFSKKAIQLSFSKIIIALIMIIVILIIISYPTKSLYETLNFGISSTSRATWQEQYEMSCRFSGVNCDRIIVDCSKDKREENSCTQEEIEKYEAYQKVIDCDIESDCDEKEQQSWDEFKEKYFDKNDDNENEDNEEGNNNNNKPDDPITIPVNADLKICKKTTCSDDEKKEWEEFQKTVEKIAANLETKSEYLMAVMAFETGGTFNPCETNKAGSGATGLIQFMPETANGLGTTTDKLCKMTRIEQMEYVEKYLMWKKGQLNTLEDVYMTILWPKAVGKGAEYTIFETQKQYEQNKGLDLNKDGKITVAEATTKVSSYYETMIA